MLTIKTLIELFDACQVVNVVAGLSFLPEKIVFVGFKSMMTKKRIDDIERFFDMRGEDIRLEYNVVSRFDYDSVCETLNRILDENEDCCFDLTGGKELVLTAMGEISALRGVPMLQFNMRSGEMVRVKNCTEQAKNEKPSMSIEECVALNGGSVVKNDPLSFDWQLDDDFAHDIDAIWRICKRRCGLWNRQAIAFGCFEQYGSIDSDLRVNVNLQYMQDDGCVPLLNARIINELVDNGLICDYLIDGDFLSFRYKNAQVRQCISKAGNILELYVYKTAKEIASSEPGFYDDAGIGVVVDWDGVIVAENAKRKETRNEIDVILMRGLVPIFISCKNGEVHKEALYELETVADKFGGDYVKKILVTTYLSSDPERHAYITQRARDMNIAIIEGVEEMKTSEFIETLKRKCSMQNVNKRGE